MSEKIVIKGGTVVDGTGAEPFIADVTITDGVITAVGVTAANGDDADRVIDATGALVTPGWVDVHTHYDGQITWESSISPSSWQGVTTVITSNCGVGFAPVRPEHHEFLIQLMEGVEDIPGQTLLEGLPWTWESFPEFLDAVDVLPHDVDVAVQIPHAPLRVFVMGDRGADHTERATPDEIDAMAAAVKDAILAGAIGFSTSRSPNHRTSMGTPIACMSSSAEELLAIAEAVGSTGRGVLQMVTPFVEFEHDFGLMERMMKVSGRPLSFSLIQQDDRPNAWRANLHRLEELSAAGYPITGQVAARPVGLVTGLLCSSHAFSKVRSARDLAALPAEEQASRMRDPELRRRILDEHREFSVSSGKITRFDRMFLMDEIPDYVPEYESSIEHLARTTRREPDEVFYDLLVDGDGSTMFFNPFVNFSEGDDEAVGAMLKSPATVLGLGDGGAHLGLITDSSFPTYLLTYWCRDRAHGRMELADAVRRATWAPAKAVGLLDRGVIGVGYKGDVNVIDHDALTIRKPEVHFDLPAGARRLVQRSDGYRHTFLNGVETFRNGNPTGNYPGGLVRGSQPAPAAQG